MPVSLEPLFDVSMYLFRTILVPVLMRYSASNVTSGGETVGLKDQVNVVYFILVQGHFPYPSLQQLDLAFIMCNLYCIATRDWRKSRFQEEKAIS